MYESKQNLMQSSTINPVSCTKLFDKNWVLIHILNLDRVELNSDDHM